MSPETLAMLRANNMLLPHKYDLLANAYEKHTQKMGEKEKIEVVNRYDFLPVVKINTSENPKNAIISTKECADCKKEKMNLGTEYDDDKREYIVAEIVIAQNSTAKIPLMVKRGFDPIGLQDEDGVLKFSCNNGSVNLKFINSDDTDYENNEEKYDLKDSEYGDEFVIEIAPTKLKRGTKFTITVYASDDDDGLGTKSKRVGICGKFNFTVIEKDVFLEEELKKGMDLINTIAGEHKKRPTSGEYSVNYCIQAADRFLGELVDNHKNFYYYDDKTNKLIHTPSLDNAEKRAEKINEMGYGKVLKKFDGSIFSFVEKNETDQYDNNPTRTLSLNSSEMGMFVKQQVGNKIGIHIFYLSIVNAFHTLFIVIKNNEPCEATFEIYDEDGLSKNYGYLKDLNLGLLMQSQWVYRWVKANPKFGYWSKLHVQLLKFQRKE